MNACKTLFAILLPVLITACNERDIILEIKGAYFRPSDCVFKNIYEHSGIFGSELTFHIYDGIYGFASADYLTKKGCTIGLHNKTRVHLVPFGFGLKGMEQITKSTWAYVGLGFQPTYVHTHDYSAHLFKTRTKWGFGGIAKAGTYINLPCHVVLDFFVAYSFVKVNPISNNCCADPLIVQPRKANISGLMIGGGLGYRFN